jgi:hypothetical protein
MNRVGFEPRPQFTLYLVPSAVDEKHETPGD